MARTVDVFLRKAVEEGIKINGVAPTSIPGRGIGLVASRNLAEGEVIMTIPIQAIRSLHTVSKDVSRRLPRDISIHGLLAAELALDPVAWRDWAGFVPDFTDFEETIPMLWPEELQKLLPTEAASILAKQQALFDKDWDKFKIGFPTKSRIDYAYAWLFVNTRTFYYETPATLKYPWHDRLALLPIADLFNHADAGCPVSYSSDGYIVTTDRPYPLGQEVYTSYGDHPNDYLLAEYGFVAAENQWDRVCLDDLLLPKLDADQRYELKRRGLLGDFMIYSKSNPRDNTWIALRLLCSRDAQWSKIINGEEDSENTLTEASDLLLVLLNDYLDRIQDARSELGKIQVGNGSSKSLLEQRWSQIEAKVRQAILEQRS